ncbi:MAG: biopolymer transporter [Desulfobacteraceae bacterium]|nr:biopolymer transporter [Desulfobacteraceae bacterium]
MNVGALLKTFIYLIASSLLYPVLFLLVVITIWLFISSGSFLAECIERRRLTKVAPENLTKAIRGNNRSQVFSKRVAAYLTRLDTLVTAPEPSLVTVENLLQETSLATWKSLDKLAILARVAPSLGLLGTLIPMGTGLAALGQGDLAALSTDLVMAFTTTVVGLAAGTAAYVLFTVKKRWMEQDVKDMEVATEILANTGGA